MTNNWRYVRLVWKIHGNKKEKNFPTLELMETTWKEIHRALIINAFAKAKKELTAENYMKPSKNKQAEHLSCCLSEHHKYSYSYKSLIKLYNKAGDEKEEVIIKKPEVIQLLSKYLGFDDFTAFSNSVDKLTAESSNEPIKVQEVKEKESLKKEIKPSSIARATNSYQIYIIIGAILVLSVVAAYKFLNYDEDQRWLRWQADHYEEVNFHKTSFKNGTLKLYTPELSKFKRIQVDTNTQFFNTKGVAVVWYFKHASGTVEFFNSYGLHPTENKYVKPVTPYILKKYVMGK